MIYPGHLPAGQPNLLWQGRRSGLAVIFQTSRRRSQQQSSNLEAPRTPPPQLRKARHPRSLPGTRPVHPVLAIREPCGFVATCGKAHEELKPVGVHLHDPPQ